MSTRVNRRALARRKEPGQLPHTAERVIPTATKARRATLFRRALVDFAEEAARARRLWGAPHLRPPSASACLPLGRHATAPGAASLVTPQRLRAVRWVQA